MTLHTLPFALEGAGAHSGSVLRNFVASAFGAPAAAFTNAVQATTAGGSHGVVGSGDFAVSQNGTPNMSVNIAAGRAVVRFGNASSLSAGAGTIFNDATTNVAIGASDPTNPRIDLVVVQFRSSTEYGEAANDARFFVIAGTPAASPAVPALTTAPNCLVLAQIAVAAAATTITNANIADKRTRATALGGRVPCTSTTRPTGSSLFEGLEILEIDTDRLWLYDGSGWVFRGWYSAAGRPGVELTDAAQTYTSGVAADITWGTEVRDVDGWTSGGIATLTVPTGWDGIWMFSYLGVWSGAVGAGASFAFAVVNGSNAYGSPSTATGNGLVAVSFIRPLVATNTVKFAAIQTSGGNLDLVSRLDVTYLGR